LEHFYENGTHNSCKLGALNLVYRFSWSTQLLGALHIICLQDDIAMDVQMMENIIQYI